MSGERLCAPHAQLHSTGLEFKNEVLQSEFVDLVRVQSEATAKLIEDSVRLAKTACVATDDASTAAANLEKARKYFDELSPEEMFAVASAHHLMLNLENIAEEVEVQTQQRPDTELDSTVQSIETLLRGGAGWGPPRSKQAIVRALEALDVDIVFTAHPTQVARQSLLVKYQQLREVFEELVSTTSSPSGLSKQQRRERLDQLRCLIHGCWRTDSLRRQASTPQEEMRSGLAYIRQFVFPNLPCFLARLDTALEEQELPPLALDKVLFRFSSWMGGDRDGNPNVTAQVTREVVITARVNACSLYLDALEALMLELRLWRSSAEFRARVDSVVERRDRRYGGAEAIRSVHRGRGYTSFLSPCDKGEPYRLILAELRDRLWETRACLNAWLASGAKPAALRSRIYDYAGPLLSKDDLLEPLYAIHRSLEECGDNLIAATSVTPLIRQAACFGLHLTALDIRQESTRHTEVMEALTKYLGVGSYSTWSEGEKVNFFTRELSSIRPLLPRPFRKVCAESGATSSILSPDCREVLATFAVLSGLPRDSLGSYVISTARTASDVLCVALLQKEFDMDVPMRTRRKRSLWLSQGNLTSN
eukprot:TRINITY_DN24428_c0_g1_i1.p1 TRINITY_DN24428_c0_g1~~TRINITY_DN24428_c0_g1_i1.p1  ORF type:complete len:592 (-),score=70.69 TRINITY_DN24428_c0_g1_i1:1509-3284(-)